jgi:hypothetical protein
MSQTVCIGTYGSRQEAEFASSLLAECGIEAMVSADDCGGVRPELAFTSGGSNSLSCRSTRIGRPSCCAGSPRMERPSQAPRLTAASVGKRAGRDCGGKIYV